jgi:hypothetical protein
MSYKECIKEVYVDDNKEEIDILEYEEFYKGTTKNHKLRCLYDHEIEYCCGLKNKSYFRHKNKNDKNNCKVGKWHLNWQNNFDENETEINFIKINEKQIKNRRADVYLKKFNTVIEFQHSFIYEKEIKNRKNDYSYFDINIIWIIDGNKGISINKNNDNKTIHLEFLNIHQWKYAHFTNEYDYIYLDINDYIYQIYPDKIKNNHVIVNEGIAKTSFIEQIKIGNFNINKGDIPKQVNLYISQQGAGNGKTYNIIQKIDKDENYNCFIIVTKQHSAKTIIKNEFQNQYNEGKLENIDCIEEEPVLMNNKYIIDYHNNKTNEMCSIIISTIDSFFFKLGNKEIKHVNKFEGIVNSIIEGYINEKKINIIKYDDKIIKLNRKLCVIIDETQDLSENYGKAIINIMKNKNVDFYVVGDLLQSIHYNKNAFSYLNNINLNEEDINKHKYESVNICRRFTDINLIKFINKNIDFKFWNLNEITSYKNTNETQKTYEIIKLKKSYDNDNNKKNLNIDIKTIMNSYKKEVKENNRKPNDFLIITPFTTSNYFIEALERAIQTFWIDELKKNERYVIFHKSQEGGSIDIDESNDATRMVSIHTSKGDGRNVVFVIGMNESGLLKFSNNEKNLIYYSLIHVALTRQKQKLYLFIDNINDNIYDLFIKNNDENQETEPSINISKFIKYNNINKYFNNITEDIIDKYNYSDLDIIDNNKKLIEMAHHNIRYSCIKYEFYKSIYNHDKSDKKQIYAIFQEMRKDDIIIYNCKDWKDYNNCLYVNNHINSYKVFSNICNNNDCKICNDKNDKYHKKYPIINLNSYYYKKLEILIKQIQKKMKNNNWINNLCLIEKIIFLYMTNVINNPYQMDITITEIYNILEIYDNSYNPANKCKYECKCNQIFNKNENENQIKPKHIKNIDEYIINHYSEINDISKIFNKFLNDNQNINTLVNYNFRMKTNENSDIKIHKNFFAISYTDDYIYNIIIKPELNELNYYDIINENIYDTYLLSNPLENQTKFLNKTIKTIIFSLNMNDYLEIDMNNDITLQKKEELKTYIKEQIKNKYSFECKSLYNYYDYYINKKQKIPPILKPNNPNPNTIPNFIKRFISTIYDDYRDDINEIIFNEKLEKRISREINDLFI